MTDKIVEGLKKIIGVFERNNIDYVIFGSAALAIKLGKMKLLKEAPDIDIFNLSKTKGEGFLSLFRKEGFRVIITRGSLGAVLSYPKAGIYLDIFHPDFFRNKFPYFKKHNAYETVNFAGMKLKIRPAELTRNDFLSILKYKFGKDIGEIAKSEDLERFLKTIIQLGMVSAYKDALGLRGKR